MTATDPRPQLAAMLSGGGRRRPCRAPPRQPHKAPAPRPTRFTHLVSACPRCVRRACCAPFGKLKAGSFVTPDLFRGPSLTVCARRSRSKGIGPPEPAPDRGPESAERTRVGPRNKSGVTIVGHAMQSQCWKCVHAVGSEAGATIYPRRHPGRRGAPIRDLRRLGPGCARPRPAPEPGEEIDNRTASCPNRLPHMNSAHAEHDIS